jgi:hypothetical protein
VDRYGGDGARMDLRDQLINCELINSGPTPGRPVLPQRIPGDTDIARDPRFQLTVISSQSEAEPGQVAPTAQLLEQARETATAHLPTRLAQCRACDGPALCEPFTRALAVLDRWDHSKARRMRAVAQYAGLWPDGYVHDGSDD